MVRTARSFAVMTEAWSRHGRQEKEKSAFASGAYAFKQAEIYARLAEDTKIFQEKAEKKRLIYQQWLGIITGNPGVFQGYPDPTQ